MKRRRVAVAATLLFVGVTPLAAQDVTSDVAWLIKVLELNEGLTVADIGAGFGEVTVALSPVVGPSGHIFATELGPGSLNDLTRAINSAVVGNVTVLEGHPSRANLPEACCDALFVRFVYHHFADPPSMNASLLESLRPGGRLAVIDFAPRQGLPEVKENVPQNRGGHGVAKQLVIDELTAAGFEIVSIPDDWPNDDYCVIFRKPDH